MKKLLPFIICLVCFAISSVFTLTGVFDYLENKSFDSRTKLTGSSVKTNDTICFIAVDQESIEWAKENKGWGWPWPRSAYGDIVRFMNAGNAHSVMFDIMFTEPSIYGDSDDQYFGDSCKEYGRAVNALYLGGADGQSEALLPVKPILEGSACLGVVTSALDNDDVVRRARLYETYGGKVYPSLGSAPVFLDEGEDGLLELEKHLPVVKKDNTSILRYRKSIDQYLPYRASDILSSWDDIQNGREPVLLPEDFEGCPIYIAYYAPGLFDICSSPVSQVYPGVGVHITQLENIYENSFVHSTPKWVELIYLLLLCLVTYGIIDWEKRLKNRSWGIVLSVFLFVIFVSFITSLSFVLFRLSVWMPLISGLFAVLICFMSQMVYAYTTEGRQKKFIKNAFSQYLSPTVIDQIVSNPEKLKLGGEKRCISIYFSDIQGFTTISEHLSPEQLTEVLNKYLSEMTDIIIESGGTIDKYEGDAIIAFWNAPVDQNDHAKRALEIAIKNQKRLEELRNELEKLCGKKIYQRIGINTGDAVVGNMGSSKRFDYTMLGDNVNLASRLEGLNKQFGTYLMCSKSTKEMAQAQGCHLNFRELGKVVVVGRNEAVTVYEPMLTADFVAKKDIYDKFDLALKEFYAGNLSAAIEKFKSIESKDPAALKYVERCKFIQEKNLPADGLWHAYSK